jgi:hypothetical protein
MRTLSTWGSDFTALPSSPYSPGGGTGTLSPFKTGQLGDSQFLSPSQGRSFLLPGFDTTL